MSRENTYRGRSELRARGDWLGTSWAGVLLGSLTIFGIFLTLGIVVGILTAAILEVLGTPGATGSEAWGLVGVSLNLLLAFFLGGYVAGRAASRSGIKHGLLAVLLALVAAMFLAVVGAMFGSGLVNSLSGARLPSSLEDVRNLDTTITVSGVLALILPFVGGALGGGRGPKTGHRRRS